MIFIARDAWSAEQCARVHGAIGRAPLSPAEIYAVDYRVDERIRRTFEAEVDPPIIGEVEEAIAGMRPRIARFFGIPLVGSEGPGFLRYPRGGFYAPHRDGLPGAGDQFPRRISVVLFLTACEGGELRVWDDGAAPIDIAPVPCTLVAFPAHCLHEVLPVTAGVRDAVVDWFY